MPHPVAGQQPIVVPQPPLLLEGCCLTQLVNVVDTSPNVVMSNSTRPITMGKLYFNSEGFIINVFWLKINLLPG